MPDQDWARLATYIVTARVAAGYETQQQFADAMGVTAQSVSNFESGKPIRRGNLARLEQVLNWEPGDAANILAGGKPSRNAGTPGLFEEPQIKQAPIDDLARIILAMIDSGVYTEEEVAQVVQRVREMRQSRDGGSHANSA